LEIPKSGDFELQTKQKTPSVAGGRLGIQVERKNYDKTLSIACLTKTSPDPTTEVAGLGLRLDLASIRILA
jgi:hypothetical protein